MQKILIGSAACVIFCLTAAGCASRSGGDYGYEASGGSGPSRETAGIEGTEPPPPAVVPPPPPYAVPDPPAYPVPGPPAVAATTTTSASVSGTASPHSAAARGFAGSIANPAFPSSITTPANGAANGAAAIFCKTVGKRTSAAQCALYDEDVANLEQGVAAFNPPRKMTKGQMVLVRLSLARDDGSTPSRAQEMIGGGDTTVVRKLKIGAIMRAQLSGGAAFQIDPAAPQDKFLGGSLEDQWEWNVTALVAGQHSLSATITVLAEDGTPLQKFINNPITVEIDISEAERRANEHAERLANASFWTEYGEKLAKLWGVWLALAIAIAVGVWRFIRTARTGTDPVVGAIIPE